MNQVQRDPTALSAGARTVARGLRRRSLSPGLVGAVASLLDAAGLGLGLWFAMFLSPPPAPDPAHATLLAGVLTLVVVAAAWVFRAYRPIVLRRLWRGVVTLLLPGLVIAWSLSVQPAGMLALVACVVPARALGAAIAAAALDFGLTERRAVIVGGGERCASVVQNLAQAPGNDIRVFGIFDDRDDSRSPPVVVGLPKLGTLTALLAFARTAEIDIVIITLPLSAERRIREILKALQILPVDVRLSDFATDAGFRRRSSWDGQSGLIEVMSRPLRDGELLVKRTLDIVGATAGLVMLSPILILTALAIRLDTPGPILFRQPRHGYNHRPVEVWKFRSMYAGDCDPSARRIVSRDDPRVTRVGRVIRRWSIDELPQLFNVLTGQLSLVGPRPHALAAVSSRQEAFEELVEGYAARHRVRPGITGWAQVNGLRGEIDDPQSLRARVEHDLYYIENWSIWFDLYVLAMTPLRLADARGAY